MKKFCIFAIFIIFNVININGEEYKTGDFKEKTGLYFQNLGPIFLSRKAYRIISYVDLEYLLNFETNLDPSCIDENTVCTTYLSIPEKVAQIKNTTLKNLELDKDHFPSQEIPIHLYGTFNREDNDLYEQLINRFTHYSYYPRNPSLPIRTTNYDMSLVKTYDIKLGGTFSDKIKSFVVTDHHFFGHMPDKNISEINLLFHHWKTDVNTLEDAVYFAKRGIIHSSVFTPKILINVLKDSKEKFKDADLPFELDHLNYGNIINVSNFRVSITNAMLIYDIEVPMIEKDSYRLYRLVPWPMKLPNQDAFFFVDPTEDFIALKAYHHSYIPFKVDEIQNCKTSQEKKICSVSSTIFDLNLPNNCESALISNHRDDFLSLCPVKLIKLRDTVWHRLDNENSWLFTTLQNSMNVFCSKKSSVTVNLTNSGWIKLNSSCLASSNTVILRPFLKHVETSLEPELTIFRLNVANIVEEHLKNSKVDLQEIYVYDSGRRAYFDLRDARLKGTSLDTIKKFQNVISMECNHIWLWSFVVVMSFIFVVYIIYENFIKNKYCNRGSSRLREEFSNKKFVSNGELIVGGSNPISLQHTVSQNPSNEEQALSNWNARHHGLDLIF